MSGPCVTPASVPSPTFSFDSVRELRDEGVVNAVLHVDAVGADAGLAHVAELGHDRALDRRVDIGVVEDDERRVAAELQRDLLHRSRRLAHEQLADLGRAGEGDEAHGRMLAHRLADRRRVAGDDVEDAGGHAGAQRKFAERQRRQRRLGRGLGDHRAADGERRRDLAGDHRGGKVPWRDRATTPIGCLMTTMRESARKVGLTSP